ncbi:MULTISPECIES: metal-sulfur cluster assembly factor [Glutamicibacter]|uniref:Metal-sulfur cluster assembly factor n=1 Tax=Glutamicibacter halophytocola TaxID=1933880 RepID=A0A5B8ITL5_9MICC|nr:MULTISPECIES: metal-sulfur cluster assembly factor [Glutamicibacter]ALG30847.1 metal-sulfur cluster biosynthetic enzyme [Glutamicibacter halophytocola]MBF6673346.1 metal-sulfur cluster assembly factor [Glutamicibacter sp. FBE19]NQD39142.1 metal-sulfur cluster assembly factor [Glutamicibacter halophytocola]QDY65497.1 metal-sulfur cluster assembly factor [Glutamicibacter halophytocola]UUX57593.1 metal-sulfur cluster assembly factor [Glutamicibacter halophytocola]
MSETAPTANSKIARPIGEIAEALKDVIDPELGVNIVDLGLVYALRFVEGAVLEIDMTLTTPACPLTDILEEQISQALKNLVTVHHINWVWSPPWGPERITGEGREQMRALGFNI